MTAQLGNVDSRNVLWFVEKLAEGLKNPNGLNFSYMYLFHIVMYVYPIYRLYKQFIEERDREAKKVVNSVQEEWEVELEKMTSKFEKEMGKKKNNGEDVKLLTIKHNKEKVYKSQNSGLICRSYLPLILAKINTIE